MIQDFQDPEQEREARITALLLGELSPSDADAVRSAIAKDPELARLHDQLARTIGLLGEAAATSVQGAASPSTLLRLPAEKRQRVLASFKVVRHFEFNQPSSPREAPWFIPLSIAAVLVVMIGAVALLPGFWGVSSRELAALSQERTRGYLVDELGATRDRGASRKAGDASVAQRPEAKPQIVTVQEEPAPIVAQYGIVLPEAEKRAEVAANSWSLPSGRTPPPPASAADSESSAEVVHRLLTTRGREGAVPQGNAPFGGGGGFGGGGLGGGLGGIGGMKPQDGRANPTSNATSRSKEITDVAQQLRDKADSKARLGYAAAAPNAGVASFERGEGARQISMSPDGKSLVGRSKDSDRLADRVSGQANEAEVAQLGDDHAEGLEKVPVLGDRPQVGGRFYGFKGKSTQPSDQNNALGRDETQEGVQLARNIPLRGAEASLGTFGESRPPNSEQGEPILSTNAFVNNYAFLGVPGLQQRQPETDFFAQNGAAAAQGQKQLDLNGIHEQDTKSGGVGTIDDSKKSIATLPLPQNTPGEQQEGKGKIALPASTAENSQWHFYADHAGDTAVPGVSPQGSGRTKTLPTAVEGRGPAMDPQLAARFGLMPSVKARIESKAQNHGEPTAQETDVAEKRVIPPTDESVAVAAVQLSISPASRDNRIDPTTGQPLPPATPLPSQPETATPAAGTALPAGPSAALLSRDGIEQRQTSFESRSLNETATTAGKEAKLAFSLTAGSQGPDVFKAETDKGPTTWERFKKAVTGNYERSARIELAKDNTDMAPLLYGAQNQLAFDPYFVQTESEKIKSKAVLYTVIEKLNLNGEWARQHGVQGQLSTPETYQLLVKEVDVHQVPNSNVIDLRVRDSSPEEAARIANTIAETYIARRAEDKRQAEAQAAEREKLRAPAAQPEPSKPQTDAPTPKLAPTAPIPQPEVQTRDNAFSTFSLNVADVSFKLAAASLEKGVMPDPGTVRSEEFLNAFDYHDPEPGPGVPVGFTWEQARDPFAHDRDLLRFSIKTAAQGRQAGYPLNLVVLLDKSGSMERADRVATAREALRVLASQLQPQDKISIIIFARTARLWADGVPGNKAGQVMEDVAGQTPEGGTNLEDALNLAYQTALRNYIHGGGNRVVLMTDGAANLGNVDPEALQHKVEANRQQGVALDCFGIGWEGFNDDILEVMSSHGDGRYGFLNTPEEAQSGFASQLAGALRVAAADVKVQVEFNPKRVTAYRQIGYAKHQLTKEQFRDNTVDAAELGAAESGNALYVLQVNAQGEGDLGWVRVRYKVPSTGDYREHEWALPYSANVRPLDQASPALRLASAAGAFSEWLVSSPYSAEVTPDRLLGTLRGVAETYSADPRPKKLEWMIRQARSISGK
jgi:Mg-chelatase subunit ChlD/capsular polysaccharide biosynthesis protein/anti-sigma factor RsiW